jgi:transposase
MIEADQRKAIYLLHEQGLPIREIARRMEVARSTAAEIIARKGEPTRRQRAPKVALEPDLLRELHADCEGYVQRVYEKLQERGIHVPYPTLTRRIRELGIGAVPAARCAEVPDVPGAEMQHDTSPYVLQVGGRSLKVNASLLYLRFSKRKYLRFYPVFNRFRMKCFFHEALSFWGYAAALCIIDNTNLARQAGSGTGKDAVIVPEMEAFGRRYGFRYQCHAVKHADRKAGEERSFWTTETNFFPGRSFASVEDLNAQAFGWATERMEQRMQGKSRVIPSVAFDQERPYLREVPAGLPAPFLDHVRSVDQYGYVAFQGNFYFVPGSGRGEVRVFEYAERIALHHGHELLLEYPLPPYGSGGEKLAPAGEPRARHEPARSRGSDAEQRRLRAVGPEAAAFLDFALPRIGRYRHDYLRKLVGLARRMSAELFCRSVERARQYRIVELGTIERIALLCFKQGEPVAAEVDESYRERPAYLEGFMTDPPDLSIYG